MEPTETVPVTVPETVPETAPVTVPETDEAEDAIQLTPKTKQQEARENATYKIRPNFQKKFRRAAVQECIQEVMSETLFEAEYNTEDIPHWCQEIANSIKNRLKEMEYERYKFVVQCVIGEQKGEAVKMVCRCFWDSDTDNYAQEVFVNNTMFCVTAAYGVYYY